MTATQFINQYITGPFVLYRKIDGEIIPGDYHAGPAEVPEDADYLEVVEIGARWFTFREKTCFTAIICIRKGLKQ